MPNRVIVSVVPIAVVLVLGSVLWQYDGMQNSDYQCALTEENAPNGVKGTFTFQIKASGIQKGKVFLNTELDYRDRRAVTISLTPQIALELTNKYGLSPYTYFLDKTITVTGEAKRVKIDFISKGRRTNKYYFQTHINVSSVEQIKVLG